MKAFLSYTRVKDQFNAVSQFREHLVNEMQLIDPAASVFQDTQNLSGGDHFPERLETEIKNADVFILLLSPAWLLSEWCRREFDSFTGGRQEIARMRRVLPLLMVSTPALSVQASDPIAAALAEINFIDWRELRHETWESPQKLQQVAKLAERIAVLATDAR